MHSPQLAQRAAIEIARCTIEIACSRKSWHGGKKFTHYRDCRSTPGRAALIAGLLAGE